MASSVYCRHFKSHLAPFVPLRQSLSLVRLFVLDVGKACRTTLNLLDPHVLAGKRNTQVWSILMNHASSDEGENGAMQDQSDYDEEEDEEDAQRTHERGDAPSTRSGIDDKCDMLLTECCPCKEHLVHKDTAAQCRSCGEYLHQQCGPLTLSDKKAKFVPCKGTFHCGPCWVKLFSW